MIWYQIPHLPHLLGCHPHSTRLRAHERTLWNETTQMHVPAPLQPVTSPSTCTRANSRQHSHPHSTQGVSPKTKPFKKLLLAHAASWSTTSPLQPHVLCATGPAQQQPPCGWWKPEQSAHPSHPSAQPAQLTAHHNAGMVFSAPQKSREEKQHQNCPQHVSPPHSSPLPQAPLQTLHLRHLLSSEEQVIASKQEMQKYSGFLAIKQKQPLEFASSDPAAWQVYG